MEMVNDEDIPFLDLDLIAHIVGQSNETPTTIDSQEVIVFIELWVQVSSISSGFCEQMALKIHP